jgi:non-heme chloroperoxidase
MTAHAGHPKSHAQSWKGHDGVTLAGQVWGQGDRPTVLLLHGGGQTRHAWKGVGDSLAMHGWRVVALDARGHGDSGWAPNGDYSLDALVGDLVSVVKSLGPSPVALVGASMGGLTSLVAVGEGRIAASALLLVDVAPSVDPHGRQRILDFMAHKPEGFDTLEEVADLISAYQPQRPRPATTAGLSKNLRVTANGKYRWHWDPAFHADASRWNDQDARLHAAARHLRLPVLLVRGQLSDVLTEASAAEFLELCPHAEYVTVRQAGHMVAGDRNDVFGASLRDFLGRHLPAAAPPSARG